MMEKVGENMTEKIKNDIIAYLEGMKTVCGKDVESTEDIIVVRDRFYAEEDKIQRCIDVEGALETE